MSHKQQMEMALTSGDGKRHVTEMSISSKMTDSILGSMHSFMSHSHSHSIDFSYHSDSSDAEANHSIATNPKNWHWDQVKVWLTHKGLSALIPIFQEDHRGHGVDGHKLLELNRDILMNEHPFDLATRSVYHFNQEDINNNETEPEKQELNETEKKELISHLLMELAKLQTKNEDFVQEQALDYTEFKEIRRRIDLFLRKWERILWIEHYEDAFNELPSKQQIADEFGVTPVISTLYIEAYENMNKQKHQDLSELFEGFNIIHDCVIWWKLIIHELKNKPRKSIWIIFEEIALYTPTPVGISLLEHFKFDLTRFPEEAVDAVCKNLVIASQYPINAALEIARWMLERADYDISRTELFQELSDNYINAALEYLDLIESDHMACIILEVKSNLNNMSAFDMALEYKLLSFVKHNRIERISNSIMNEYKFLDPINKNETFKINPLSTHLFWSKLWTREFYFTPLGLYASQSILYIVYLFLFTYLSSQQFRVYDDMTIEETVFWVFNIGYVLYEVFSIIDEGLHIYLSQASNYFDFVISSLFIASFAIRIYVWIKKQFLGGLNCELESNNASNNCADLRSNTIFVILWGINTIALWIRLTFFCVLSASLGPMIRMVQRMMSDIIVFLEIIGIILIGFIVCLVFVVGDVLDAFASFPVAFLTLFRASQGDFDWEQLDDAGEGVNPAFLLFAYLIISVYMIIAAIVLLNLLIAMMAKTFDSINETTISQIIFARFELALELDNESSFMPPPLNVFAMMGMIIFYIIEFIINHTIFCCTSKHHFDLCVFIMPNWLKYKKLELDSQIVGSKCHILTSEGDSIGLITSFDSDVHHHEITFYEDENEIGKKSALKKNVIIGNHINKKNKWNVDLFHLSQEKYLKLDQFKEKLTSDITLHFKQDSLKDRKKHHKSHHWICKYCRMYVKESKISVKRLGRELNVNDRDLKLLTNIAPEICPNCYRVRHTFQRWRLIWEILSLYIYYLGVFPILFILFSLLLCISMIRNPHEAVHNFQILRKKIHHYCKHITCCKSLRNISNRYDSNTRAALKLMHAEDVHHEDSDSESSSSSDSDEDLNINYETMSVKQIKKIKSKRKDRKKDYVVGHYDSHELIHTLHHIGHGDTDELFDHSISADIWTNLSSSKKSIDLFIMRSRVSEHIISLSTEDEITQLDFYIDFINYEDIDFTKWEILFKPFAHSIFAHVHDSREMELPLHLFAKYPMAPRMVLDDFEHWHHAQNNKDIKINECKSEDIISFLEEYGSLRCRDRNEYKYLLHHITESDEYKHDHHTEYDQFVAYLKEVRLLFTETKKLKNLIRDVGIAILERGPDHEIIRQEIDLLFEEIPTSIVALPFFRAMKQETDIIKLWTIRNFLKVIYLLRALVKDTMLDMNPHVYVTKKLLIRLVFEKFKNKIVDKRNIMMEYMSKKKKRKLERIKTKVQFKLDTNPNSPNINPNNSSDSDKFSSDEESDEEEEEWKGHERSLKDDDDSDHDNNNKGHEIEIERFKKKRKETGHDNESDHSHDKREEMRMKRKKQLHKNQLRIKLLHTNRVTASTIAKVVGFIFDQIRFGRKKKAKITSSTMEHYQHKLPLGFRNNISLHFIYSQLCRYIIFKPYSLKEECTNEKLKEIIECCKYDSTHIIDIQSKPNYGNIENIYKHIKLIYDLSNIQDENKHPFMTIEDVVCIILLFYRIFDNLEEKINGRSDEFVVTRPVFQKFCDRDNFRPGMDPEKWSKTAKEASNLFQSVLDTEQNYVTLGELRQTIIHLINDVDDMKSGHLIRIKNYLMERVQKDEDRRAKNLPKYKKKLLKWKQIHKNDIDNKSDDDDDENDEKSELVSSSKKNKKDDKKSKKKPKNPKLQYAMINVANFSQFISKISEGYVPKIDGHKINTKHNNNNVDEKKDDDDDDEEFASDLFSRIASVAICVVDEKHDKISEDNEIETETENKLQSDIEKMKKSLANLENDSEIKQEEEVKEKEKEKEKEFKKKGKEKHNYFADVTIDTKKMNRKYKTVYDYMLLKYEHRITLQQLMQYLRSFKRWLESNEYLITMIKNYDLAEDDTENEDLLFKLEEKMKKTKIGSYAQFFAKYFGNQCYKNKNFTKEQYLRHISKRDREIRWIFDQCHKEFDLIYLLTPFIHGKIIKEIDELLDSSDDVEGNYELRSEEFAQLKHQLHVNGHAAVQLFHIMRAHQQALSWKQILSYFIFLNKIKVVIDDCIRRNQKGEDADLSIDKMKLELHITSQDEANWLFQTVEHHHAQKVSWKHFRNYLNKSLMIRQDVKDFFDEQEAQHEYNENAYVLIQKLQQSVDNINNK